MKTYTTAHSLMAGSMMNRFGLAAHARFMSADGEVSLADLADIDVSDIDEVRFENLPPGVYEFEVLSADLGEKLNRDQEKRFLASFEFKIMAVKSVLKGGIDKESLVGKVHKEQLYINPADTQDDIKKAIGRIRAFVSDMGCESAGKLGDIVANTKGHSFTSKIVEQKDRSDSSIVYARLRLEPAKKKAA